MIKSINLLFCFQLLAFLSVAQSFTIGNDSIVLTTTPIVNGKGKISAFSFKLTNQSNQRVLFGVTEKQEPISYAYKLANTLIISCGGTVPALYNYYPEFLSVSELKKADTLFFNVEIGRQYGSSLTLTRNEYSRLRKIIIIDYMVGGYLGVPFSGKMNYSDFLKKKQRLYLELKP